MLDDGTKAAGKEEHEVRVADISMHLLEAIERAEATAGDAPRYIVEALAGERGVPSAGAALAASRRSASTDDAAGAPGEG